MSAHAKRFGSVGTFQMLFEQRVDGRLLLAGRHVVRLLDVVAVDHRAGARDQRLQPRRGLGRERGRGFERSAVLERLAGRDQQRIHGVGELVEPDARDRLGRLIGGDRELAVLEVRGVEMLLVGQGLPADQLHDAFRHLRQQIEQHDRFVEVVEIVGREPGLRIDIGGRKARGIDRRARRVFVREQGDRGCHRAANGP